MAEARLQTEWDRTVSLIAVVHNVNYTESHHLIRDPSTLNPLRKKIKAPKVSLAELRELYTGRKINPIKDGKK